MRDKKRICFFTVVVICGALFVLASAAVRMKPHDAGQEQRAVKGQVQALSAEEEALSAEAEEEQPPTAEELAEMEREEIRKRFDEDDKVIWKDCADTDRVVLDFIGDINLDENWKTVQFMDAQGNGIRGCLSADVMDELNGADILLINNEFTLSTKGKPIAGKDYTFRGKPSRVKVLQDMGADIASLANNHAYDYGPEALEETMDVLTEADIPYVGAGRNIEEAMKPVYFVANNKVISIVAATQIERSTNYTKEATEDRAGVLKTLNPDKFLEVIREARGKSDYVIAYVHWGTENTNYYGSDQVELAKKFVDAGVDVIIGGHTHCLQGIDYVDHVPVIYSLGNFWFNYKTIDTGISQVVIHEDDEIEFRFLPCVQKSCKTYMAEDKEKQGIIDFMNKISGNAHIDESGTVNEQ